MCCKGLKTHRLFFWGMLMGGMLLLLKKLVPFSPLSQHDLFLGIFQWLSFPFLWLISQLPTSRPNPKTLLLSLLLRIYCLVPSHTPRKRHFKSSLCFSEWMPFWWRAHEGKCLFLFCFCFRFPRGLHTSCSNSPVPWGSTQPLTGREGTQAPSPTDREEMNRGSSGSGLPLCFLLCPSTSLVCTGIIQVPHTDPW